MDFSDFGKKDTKPEIKEKTIEEAEHPYLPYFLIVALFAIVIYFIGLSQTKSILFTAMILLIKTIIYSVLLFLIFIMAAEKAKYTNCFYTAIIIAAFSLIPDAFLKFSFLILMSFYLIMGFRGASMKTYMPYIIFLIISEVVFGILI